MLVDITYDGPQGYSIIDTEFGEVRCDHPGYGGNGVCSARAGVLIKEYSKRNLNVAANLAKLFLLLAEKHNFTIEEQIRWCEGYNLPSFKQYKEEMQKYLVLA